MISTEAAARDAAFSRAVIERPHPDIELGVKRTPLRYAICAPAAGTRADTGLILYIGGYGMDPHDAYTQSLLAYLANQHNCIAATLDYFGASTLRGMPLRLVPHPDFFKKLAEHYGLAITAAKGMAMDEILASVTGLLAQNGITQLHEECTLFNNADEYNSMGLLPALDGLQVVHALLTERALDKSRLFLLGTSYGGYIASFMAKLAPATFRMVVDNSGFSSADDDQPALLGWQKSSVNGVAILCQNVRNWSFDRRLPNFFSPAHRAIRDLLRREHVFPNAARIYAYHAATDAVAPIARKIGLRETYRDRAAYDLTIVDEGRIDGHVFKALRHGLNASMRGVFDLSHERFRCDGGALSDSTDFDQASEYVFACGRENYVARFSLARGVSVERRAA